MKEQDIKRLGLILALQAEIEGMKIFNQERLHNDMTLGYNEEDFQHKADELRNTVAMHNYEI